MKYLPLVLAGIGRHRVRAALIAAQIVCVFLLFGVLQGLDASMAAAIRHTHAERMFVGSKLGSADLLPVSLREESVAELRGFLDFVSYFIGAILAVAAICAAASSLYAAVDARRREIATLRGVGFGGFPVLVSILAEGVVLSIGAATLGAALARWGFQGRIVSTHDLTFPLDVGPREMAAAAAGALLISLIGGAIPGIRASRIPVVAALRAN